MKKPSDDKFVNIYTLIAIIFIGIWAVVGMTRGHIRSANNMEYITSGYVYNKHTKIVYSENGFIVVTYTELRNEDGSKVVYFPETGRYGSVK